MAVIAHDNHGRSGRRPALYAALLAGLSALAGCASMDDFNIKRMNFEVFRTPGEPLEVIAKSEDGSARARAIAMLREPMASGGSQKDQDTVVTVLCHAAAHDRMPICRIKAINVLRTFKDPRAVDGLKEAYYRAGAFHADTASIIRRLALDSLGETRQEAAVDLLVRVLRAPPAEGADTDRQQQHDERMTAARALGRFHSPQASAALVEVLAKEEDPGMQQRAKESLVAITGKELPPDAKMWNEYLSDPRTREAIAQRKANGPGVLELVGFRR